MNKKTIIIILIILLALILIFGRLYLIYSPKPFDHNNTLLYFFQRNLSCSSKDELVIVQGYPKSCCSGLEISAGWPNGWQGECADEDTLLPPTGLLHCIDCGDGVCSKYEGKCNCPKDCPE